MLVLFQKIEQDTASTIDGFSKVPTVEDSANIVRTECQQLRTEVLTEVKKLSHKEAECRKDDRKDDQQVLVDTMRNLLRFFRHTAQAQQSQAQQSQKTPDCCCFNFLPCFARKAVIDNQQQPEPPFIKDQESLMKDLEYEVGQRGKGKGRGVIFSDHFSSGQGLFSSGGMGTGIFSMPCASGGLFGTGASSGGGLFGSADSPQDALDALP